MTNASPAQVALCSNCSSHCTMTVHGSVTMQPDPDRGRDEPEHLMLTTCNGCGEALLLVQEYYPDDSLAEPEALWPLSYRPIPPGVPHKVAKALSEARRCYELAHAYPPVAMSVRLVVEQICKDHGAIRGTLGSKLNELEANGIIDGRLLSWATSLRFLGNNGAHGDNVTRQDAEDGLALAEAVVDYVYVIAARHTAFEQRRAAAPPGRPAAVPVQTTSGTNTPNATT
ncbi:DUF4145 domain-containing protein [Kitasatospora sp. NPDC001574]